MAAERSGLLQTRVGRRVVLLFVLCALLPVTILAVATYRSVGEQLGEQARVRAHEASKRVGMALAERLEGLAEALAVATGAPASWSTADPRLGALLVQTPAGPRAIRGDLQVPELTAAQRAHLNAGRTLLLPGRYNAETGLLLGHALRGGAARGVLWAQPRLEELTQLIAAEESAQLGVAICVLQPPGIAIHCQQDASVMRGAAAAGPAPGSEPYSFEWRSADGERYLAGAWSLFLAYSYAAPDWRIIYSESARSVYGPLTHFRRTFTVAALLALAVVGLLSHVEIRRGLQPLRALREATERVARREFDQPVDIRSGDEFEGLGHSFNGMSRRLQLQFEAGEYLTRALQDATADLSEREAQLRAVLESAADGILVVSVANQVESVNAAAERLFGYRAAEAAGRDLAELIGQRIGETDATAAGPDGGATFQATGRHRDGTTFPIEVSVGRAQSGERVFHTVFVRDISERTRAQEERERLEGQLRQAQKMETIGTLAGGIAHDFNNILTPIMVTTELVLSDAALDAQLRADLDQVGKAAHRARDLVRQILTFSRRTESARAPVSLGPLVQEALKFVRASLPATIEIRSQVAAELPEILGDATQLHQVVMNLCTNAYHAMRDRGGVLDVRLEAVTVDGALAATHPRLAAERVLRLSIRDTGCGMDASTLERLYEPFFTTKPTGEGTGLGMSITHGIVAGHGGAIMVDSLVGAGTRFDIYLPAGQAVMVPVEVQSAAPERHGQGRVLVVDDDSVISGLVTRLLKRAGYDAVSATSPAAALRHVETDARGFDLVVTDHAMPGMTGIQLAQQVRARDPDLPLVLMSGYAEFGKHGDEARRLFADILVKPVDIKTLTACVARVLDTAGPVAPAGELVAVPA